MLRTILFLAAHGVPFDVAGSLSEDDLLAWSIIVGENEGGVFDFARMEWCRPDLPRR